jgi:general secretion pathway protein D
MINLKYLTATVMAGLLVSLAGGQAVDEEPQVVIIEPTNSLLINATAEQHERIMQILGYVDTERLEEEIPYAIYPLENQDPVELAEVLNQLVQETIKDKEGKIERIIKKEEEVTIIGDQNTFSLIVYASKKNQEWIKKLIKELDKRRPQVLIDVSLVEITREKDFEWDLNLLSSFPDLTNTSGQLTGLIGDPCNFNLVQRLIDSGRDRFIDLQFNPTIDAKSRIGFYGDRHINALLEAMEAEGYGRVLARPKILVNDNEEGIIKATKETHRPETTVTYAGEAVHKDVSVKWPTYEAKIELTITPHISEGDLLRLEVMMVREDFGESTEVTIEDTEYTSPPDRTISDVDTTITVPDGSTIILGGLTKLSQFKRGSKTPLLGDIPLVGGLFRTIDNTDRTSKLYVFVKANIVRPDETLKQLQDISEKNKATFEEMERKFQEKEDWPGIKPKPMKPEKALED